MNWLDFNNQRIVVDGLVRVVKVSSHKAIYPYAHTVLCVHLHVEDKNHPEYIRTKEILGDHWFTDVLESDPEFQEKVINALSKPLSDQEVTCLTFTDTWERGSPSVL